ncbi:hypothetical protein D3C76_1146240 [compost metagenome]
MAAGEFHLGADVAGQGLGRVVFGGEGVEGAVPEFQVVAQHGDVQPQLVAEVVVQVGLGQPGAQGDGVHAGALEAMARELLLGGGEYQLFVLLTDAADGFRGRGWAVGGHQ